VTFVEASHGFVGYSRASLFYLS